MHHLIWCSKDTGEWVGEAIEEAELKNRVAISAGTSIFEAGRLMLCLAHSSQRYPTWDLFGMPLTE